MSGEESALAQYVREHKQTVRTSRPEPKVKAGEVQGKIPVLQFVLRAIVTLRDERKSMGVHMVYGRFNTLFKRYYGSETDPVWEVERLEKLGHVRRVACKGGAMLYLPGEAPQDEEDRLIETITGGDDQ